MTASQHAGHPRIKYTCIKSTGYSIVPLKDNMRSIHETIGCRHKSVIIYI
jgi:hypothetical protein